MPDPSGDADDGAGGMAMTPRLRRVAEIHGDALVAAVLREADRDPDLEMVRFRAYDAADRDPEAAVLRFRAHDPSPNASATQWLVTTYVRGGFRLEDLPKARDTLAWFSLHRAKLPEVERSLNRYRDLASMWRAVKGFVEADAPVSNRAADRAEREIARAESRILVEREDGFTVAVPLTERASCWWGRGTRWCTAACWRAAPVVQGNSQVRPVPSKIAL